MKRKAQVDDVPALFDLTPYTVEPAGEYIPDPSWDRNDSGANDSGASEELAAGEQSAPESNCPDTESAPESNSPDKKLKSGWLSTYLPTGTARGRKDYFRYSWRAGKRVHHVHVPGGNTGNPTAQRRAQKIREAIALGLTPSQILQILKV